MNKEVMKEPLAWIFEDELPKNYPYEEMFPYSKVDVVRMFPIFGPSSKKEQASSNNEVLLQYSKEDVEWQKQQMEHAQQLNAEALKQEQGEPVAWWNGEEGVVFAHDQICIPNWTDHYYIPLYTTPQTKEWVSLTKMELYKIGVLPLGKSYKLYQAIDAKLKEKNT